MPTYDYRCPECKNVKEIHHSIHETPCIQCDQCMQSYTMIRIIGGGVGLHFQGSGFYVNDYTSS